MSLKFDREKTKKNIAVILDKVKNEADPEILNKYRSLFKREVSLFSRSYVAAYLLMLYEQGNSGRSARHGDGFSGRGTRRREQEQPENFEGRSSHREGEENRYPLAEEDSKYLFISIGRNRRVFPREILGLINAKTAVPKEDVGAIRILDKYSFVQVRDSSADAIIEALNGKPFRGRVLQVNYAHTRREASEEEIPSDEDAPNQEDGTGVETALESGQEQDENHPDKENI
ncbi:MAG: DbpA RNA binding domain-containing protein [Treponema sp.]|jgi:hypothetical protein|nr:DbpA RNA binding domain-containing protein [Treponema sp.]